MPQIARFGSFKLLMFFQDENPPHVHIKGSDFAAKLRISNGDLLAGGAPNKILRQARRWVEGAAYTSDEFMADVPWGKNYASVHGLPQQRFYNLICLAYGADPVTFADVAENMTNMMAQKGMLPKQEQGVLPKQRAENCAHEFQTVDHAFKTLIRPHVDLELRRKVLDMSWFPEPRRRVRPSPTPAAASSRN